MDLKGSLVDTKVKIYPSKALLTFLKALPIEKGIPTKILQFNKSNINNLKELTSEPTTTNESVDVKIHLTDADLDVISKIKGLVKFNPKAPELFSEAHKGQQEKNVKEKENKISKDDEITKKKSNDKNEIESKDAKTSNDEKSEQVELKYNMKKPNETSDQESLYLTTTDIEWLHFYLTNRRKSNENDIPHLHELLEGSQLQMPENITIKRNPDLEARCVKLRAQEEARQYRKMTKGVDNVRMRFPEDSISYQLKQLNRQLISIIQFIISIAAGFLFGFRGIELIVEELDFGFRLLLGVMCALIIALAEIYFLAKKLNEELNIPETVQLGGPTKFADETHSNSDPKLVNNKEHQD